MLFEQANGPLVNYLVGVITWFLEHSLNEKYIKHENLTKGILHSHFPFPAPYFQTR